MIWIIINTANPYLPIIWLHRGFSESACCSSRWRGLDRRPGRPRRALGGAARLVILAFGGTSALGMVLMLEAGPGCGDRCHLVERLDLRRLEDRPLCWWARNREASESCRASSEDLSAVARSCLRLAASSAARMSWSRSPLASSHR